MSFERVLRSDDPRLADYRDLRDGELIRNRGLFVAEGRLVVRRVIEDGRYRIRSLLLSDAARLNLGAVVDAIAQRVPVYLCDAGAFLPITGFNIHRGCLALVERPSPAPVDSVLASACRVIVLDGLANADNVGGIFRNAAAFGIGAVLLGPTTCDPFYRKAIRTSMAATLRVPHARFESWPDEAITTLRAAGFSIVVLTPREPADDMASFAARRAPDSKMALIVGAEGEGLTPEVERAADVRVRIPIDASVDSLNVAVAAGIAMYALCRGV